MADRIHVCRGEDSAEAHPCLVGRGSDAKVSEIAAVGFVVDSISTALPLHEAALGAKAYMNEEFTGPGVEKMNALDGNQRS